MEDTTQIFSVILKNSRLPKIRSYGQVDEAVRVGFSQNNISIAPDTPIIRNEKESKWRIVSEKGNGVDAYALTIDFNQNDDLETINVYKDTLSGFPNSIWDFEIFSSGMVNGKSKRKILYNGKNRYRLNHKQKQKWDYFFRPELNIVEERFTRLSQKYTRELLNANSKLTKSIASIIIIVLILAFFYFDGLEMLNWRWDIDLILILLALGYGFTFLIGIISNKISLNLIKLNREAEILKHYLKGFEEEKAKLYSQLAERQVPKETEILTWMQEEAHELESVSRSKYVFDPEEEIQTKRLNSFAIYQPEFTIVKQSFAKEIDTFYAFRYIPGTLLYSGQFFVFIFLTGNKICISKLFYDFILGKKYKEANREYHFTDLVGIAINSILVNNPFELESDLTDEVSAIWMSFMDSNSMEIAIIDDDTSSDIVSRIDSGSDKKTTFTLESLDDNASENQHSLDTTSVSEAMAIVRLIKEQKQARS